MAIFPSACRAEEPHLAAGGAGERITSAQHITDANSLLGIGGVNRAWFIEAPGPRRAARAFQTLLGLLELVESELRVHCSNAIRVGTRLDGIARNSREVRAILDIAGTNRDLRVAWLRYAGGRSAEHKLLPAQIILRMGWLGLAKCSEQKRDDGQSAQADTLHEGLLSRGISRMLPSVPGGPAGCLGFIWSLASARLAIGYRPTMGSGGSIYFVRLLR
jgi:hypothetical protein